jgi:trimeric autotransporter adhesin
MKPELKNKLKVYASMTAASVVVVNNLNSQVIVRNIDYSGSFNYDLDVDGNGTIDFLIRDGFRSPITTFFDGCQNIYNNRNYWYVEAKGVEPSNSIVGFYGMGIFNYPVPFIERIDSCGFYIKSNIFLNSALFYEYGYQWAWGSNTYDCGSIWNTLGRWTAGKFSPSHYEGIIGLKFLIDGDVHYGWCRLKIGYSGLEIYDVGYESTPDVGIYPQARPQKVISITPKDIYNYGNGEDLEVTFYRIPDESNVSEYRVFVVKEEEISNFNLNAAESNSNYVSIVPNGSSKYVINFSATSADINGDLIINDQPYKIFILNIADGTKVCANNLSSPSSSITLKNNIIASSLSSSITAKDISNNGNATDLEVKFNKAVYENTVGEYRAYIVKYGNTFSLSDAEANSNYKLVLPNGSSNYTINYLIADTDVDGDIIKENVYYKAYILSMADGVIASINNLSSPSSIVALKSPHNVLYVQAYDISNNKDATDLEVKFSKAMNESAVAEYRAFVIKGGTSFSKIDAESNSNYKIVSPSGLSWYTVNYLATDTDTDGDIIIENQPYNIHILSIADGINVTANNLSSSSNNVTLTSPIITSSIASNINAQDISNNGNATDLQVKFNKAADEATVGEYRAFVVKDGTSFSKTIAENSSNYKTVSPSGLSQYTINYLAADTDTDGDIIIENQPYRVFVLSMADGTIATVNSLSSASNKITLTTPIIASSTASNIVASDIANNKDARDLQVEFSKAAKEATLDEYRVFICKYYNIFNLNDAENNTNFTIVPKSGYSKYIVNFLETTLDTDGDLIVEDVWYKVYVMSVADGVNANTNSLSNPSNNIKLTTPLGLKENTTNFNTFYKNNLLHINVDNTLVGADIEVVNLLGEKVLSNRLDNANNQFTLNVANGMYVVIVRKDDAVVTKKIVVH